MRVIRPLSSCPKTAMVCQVNKNKLIVYASERERERDRENERDREKENERERKREKNTTSPQHHAAESE